MGAQSAEPEQKLEIGIFDELRIGVKPVTDVQETIGSCGRSFQSPVRQPVLLRFALHEIAMTSAFLGFFLL